MNGKPRIKVVDACALLLSACAGFVFLNAHALEFDPWSHFTVGPFATQRVFCDTPEIRGDTDINTSRYVSRGTCVELQGTTPKSEYNVNRSEFDDYSHAKEIFRAGWTAEASYNPVTKEAWEKITFPAPTLDKPAPTGQPYGRFELRMICATDPWLEFGSPHCTAIHGTATGSLGDIEKMLQQASHPFTANGKNTQALYDAHQAFLKRSAALAAVAKTTTQTKEALRSVTLPEILEPRAGNAYPPETPLKVRVIAPRNLKVQTYELQFESKQNNGSWQTVTNVPVAAAELEGPLGYTGWGWHPPHTGPLMTAWTGTYRLRARVTSPSAGEPGEWREFTIAGKPGVGLDVFRPRPVGALSATTQPTVNAPAAQAGQLQRAASSPDAGTAQKPMLDWSKAAGGIGSQMRSRLTP
jgi:hypothetical protein